MDTALKYRLDVIIALLFLLVLIESYRVAGYFGPTLLVVVTIVLVAFAPE
ncbi:hypothetical protein C456_15110 [Haloferax volcanii DSM 14919]|uniref:Uncharacterized protein n=1 Tax=Haloferax lucentense (strain DSM 14919 / JCM 9276 / NCIMB 13854 / Aa 2.2) TaxID=1230452 RepID=M0GHM4_HALL2|nr:hypothetical protein [Haloferax lucentense]ELZ71017.1 hypothetical protein C456_15110 [Haloferax lucentense DSM 14919]